jgi:hypothetical protein
VPLMKKAHDGQQRAELKKTLIKVLQIMCENHQPTVRSIVKKANKRNS